MELDLQRIENIIQKEEIIIERLAMTSNSFIDLNRKSKNFRLDLENIKQETKEFGSILKDTQIISESIHECCEKITNLDKILSDQIVWKYKNEVLEFEKCGYRELKIEEDSLKGKLKDLQMQIRDLQLKDSIVHGVPKRVEKKVISLKDIQATHDTKAIDDFLNS